jgi:hypothetical protein
VASNEKKKKKSIRCLVSVARNARMIMLLSAALLSVCLSRAVGNITCAKIFSRGKGFYVISFSRLSFHVKFM